MFSSQLWKENIFSGSHHCLHFNFSFISIFTPTSKQLKTFSLYFSFPSLHFSSSPNKLFTHSKQNNLPREQPLFHPKIPNEWELCVNKWFSSCVGSYDWSCEPIYYSCSNGEMLFESLNWCEIHQQYKGSMYLREFLWYPMAPFCNCNWSYKRESIFLR